MTVWTEAANGSKSFLRLWRCRPDAGSISLFATMREWRRHRESRRELMRLDDRALRDLGISRADVFRELNKSFRRR
jgi:uncharacterized protein YjiS (DUF1127 family)